MFVVENLLRNELIPLELPPCFNTNDLADNYKEIIAHMKTFNHDYSIPVTFSGYKTESSRRKFSIPNPYHYCKLVDYIVENQKEINKIFSDSKYSLTAPTNNKPSKDEAYSKKVKNIGDTKKEIESLFKDNKYEIKLDINDFFGSIYTHSIPWVIHGKTIAKKKQHDDTLLGNKLDSLMRALNYNQTNGILVGNAVSRIVSEIILCTIDKQIKHKFKDIDCCRYVDDYYIYTKRSEQIQEIIAYIRTCLSQYELSFNENKISISESPFIYGKPWVEIVKHYIHLAPEVFLTHLIIEFKSKKDIAILKYGLKVLEGSVYSQNKWKSMESRLVNLWVKFPALSDRLINIFLNNKELLNKTLFKKAIYTIIDDSILLSKDQELIWAIWCAKVFNINLSQKYIAKVLDSSNQLAIILILDIVYKNKKEKANQIQPRIQRIRTSMDEADLNGERKGNLLWSQYWLLAYEATRNKWLKVPGKPFEYAKKNQFFKVLINKNIKFYDEDFTYSIKNIENKNKTKYVTSHELDRKIDSLKNEIMQRMKLQPHRFHMNG